MTQTIESKSQSNPSYNCRDVYKAYQEMYGKEDNERLAYTLFKKIFVALNKALIRYILSGRALEMPYNVGKLRIRKMKNKVYKDEEKRKKFMKVDWKTTMALWEEDEEAKAKKKKIYFLNEHTGMFYYRWKWSRGPIKNSSIFTFKPTRANKKELSKLILQGQDYL